MGLMISQDEYREDDDLPVMFCAQEKSYDCGVACVRMAYSWSNEDYTPSFDVMNIGHPLWTVDLLGELLKSKKMTCVMFTLHSGVQKHHHEITWYKENLKDDFERVDRLFALDWPIRGID